jgi:hypothetical protein
LTRSAASAGSLSNSFSAYRYSTVGAVLVANSGFYNRPAGPCRSSCGFFV